MKPEFLTTPEAWTRASRTIADPVRAACAIERTQRRASRAERIGGDILAALIALALVAIGLHEMGALL